MQYHKAANLGQERSRKAQMKLFEYTGFSMLTYTIKKGNSGFEPVGEEMLVGNLNNGKERKSCTGNSGMHRAKNH